MSKVKQWAEDVATKTVDKILLQVKQNLITKETASADILKVENVAMTGIDENNVDEVIAMECA
jgi:predicted peptidase